MNTKKLLVLVLVMAALLCACGKPNELNDMEIEALNDIFDKSYTAEDLKDITDEAMKDRQEKFKAVKSA